MAVWQYRFGLVPRQPLIERYGKLPNQLDAHDFENAWIQQPTLDFSRLIDAFALPYCSWSPEILMWGAENGNRIHVVVEQGKVEEVSCRIWPREPYSEFAAGVIALAESCDWVLVLTGDAVAAPRLDTLVAAVANSNAAKFVAAPLAFFDGLSDGSIQPE